jgi:mRNA interferase RelE/StbE
MMMSGNKNWLIEYLGIVIQEDFPSLPASVKPILKRAIEERLMIDPIGYGKPLRYSLKGHRCIRVSDYRVVYRLDSKKHQVIIVVIKQGKDVYED